MLGLIANHSAGISIIAALILLFVSDALYRSVIARAKPFLPGNLQERHKASFSISAFMWEPGFPDALRRQYLWSIACGTLAVAFTTLFIYRLGHPYWAAFFGCMFLFAAGFAIMQWSKYRRLQ